MDLTRRNERLLEVELQQIVESAKQLDLGLESKLLEKRYVQCASGSYNTTSNLAELCHSGNAFVDKIVIAFATLASEADLLTELARTKFYPALLLYGEEVDTNANIEVTPIKFMSKFLPFLNETNLFVNRCFEVCRNTLLQIYGFFGLGSQYMEKAGERQLWRAWRIIGDILVILITLDEIVNSRQVLVDHFKTYQRSIELVRFNPTQFGVSVTDGRLKALFSLITEIDNKLMQGNIFVSCCQQFFCNEIPLNKQFMERLKSIISDSLVRWERVAQEDIPDKHRLMVLSALSILYYTINQTKSVDKKLLKTLAGTQKRIMSFHLIGDILFTPLVFLQQKLPSKISQLMDKKLSSPQFLVDAFSTLLDQQAEQLTRESQFAAETISEWKAEMRCLIDEQNTDTELTGGARANQLVMLRCNTLLKGAHLADRMSRLVKCILSCHLFEDRPISKSNARNIFCLIEMIKSVVATINFHWPSIIEWVAHASLFLSSRVVRIFEAIRAEFNAKTSNPYLVDIISALKLASTNLAQSPSKNRLFICGFALEVAHYTKNFRLSEVIEVDELIQRLDSIFNIGSLFKRVTDCSFLYWHRSLCAVYFESFFEDYSISPDKLLRFFDALDDSCPYIQEVKHIESDTLLSSFRTEIFDTLKESLLDRLCAEIENDLRLSVHERQNVSISTMETNLLKTKQTPIRSVQQNAALVARLIELLQMPPIVLAGQALEVSTHVESRMDKTFYDLTAVALHDSESYSQMRTLAAERYNLHFIKNHLPYMGIDQGLDLLRIVTNLATFVSNFNYDFNEQMFIEKNSKSKMFNVIRVQNAVGSIKTHGFGILNSTINYAYRVLAKKFRAFSRFLFDEQIKGQLVKDIRYYRDSIDDLKQMYPVKRAERFNNAVAKLGVSASGQTYLDGFRELITQIGNIVGFVRMVRSAAAESNAFMIECENALPHELLGNKSTDDPSKPVQESESAEHQPGLDSSSGDDYVEMLVGVFTKEFRNMEKFGHLRNFFIIIPPLCMNYVEHMIASRLRLSRRVQQEEDLTFVDDGFSLGIAYILTLLNQIYFFSSLNWFASVELSLKASQESVAEEQRAALRNKDESYAQSLAIRLKRLQDFQDEFQYLGHTLHSSIMIFKTKDHPTTNQEESFLEDF